MKKSKLKTEIRLALIGKELSLDEIHQSVAGSPTRDQLYVILGTMIDAKEIRCRNGRYFLVPNKASK